MKEPSDQNPKELFEAATSWFDTVFEQFREFRYSAPGKVHWKTLNSFLHEAMRADSALEHCLAEDKLPERGRSSMRWVDYNKTLTNIGLMKLILELWKQE